MKKISLLLGAALMVLVMASCGSSKAVVTDTQTSKAGQEIAAGPCDDFLSTSDIFRATGQHVAKGDRQIQFAYDQAADAARAALAAQIGATVKRVNDNYANEHSIDLDAEQKGRIEQMTRTIVQQEVKFAPIVCKKKTWGTEPGTIVCHIAVEIPVQNILKGITSSIANDEKLRTDYEYEKYKKVFDEEMGKQQ